MINIKSREFIKKLITKTNERLIQWEEGVNNYSFSCNFSSGKIGVSSIFDTEIGDDYAYVNLINDLGASSVIASEYKENGNYEDYKLLIELYNVASNSFYKIDESIDKFTQELDSIF